MKVKKLMSHSLALVLGIFVLSSCGRSEKEYQTLMVENQRLKAELEKLRGPELPKTATETNWNIEVPDLDLSINELWTQRFDYDNEYRAKKMLTDKIIRVTGLLENVTDTSVSLFGSNRRFSNVRLTVNLNSIYAARVRTGLLSLGKGTSITVQGRFLYDRMWLANGVFVNKATGKAMTTDELAGLTPDPAVKPLSAIEPSGK